MKQIRIGVIGYGYWGPNLVRNFQSTPHASVSWISDLKPEQLRQAKQTNPLVLTTNNYRKILDDKTVDAVVIATPVSTHASLAIEAITAGKHILIEKPMTLKSFDAKKIVRLAVNKRRVLMVDHTFIYTPGVQKIRDYIKTKELGDVFYIDSVRTNLGIIQRDSNVIYDLAAHDFAILDYLIGTVPAYVSATGTNHLNMSQEPVAHITAKYSNNLYVHCNVSWMSPVKIRTMQIIGSKKMIFYDDMEPSEKVKVYDKGILIKGDINDLYQRKIGYRLGSMTAPNLPLREGLSGMAQEFIQAILTKKNPQSDGNAGVRVVRILEAATKSLRNGGSLIKL